MEAGSAPGTQSLEIYGDDYLSLGTIKVIHHLICCMYDGKSNKIKYLF